jgi:carbon-monoxide dehydrogenase small subunit
VQAIQLRVNGEWERLTVEPQRTLLEMLREDLGLTGTKNGCERGECGTCTVLLDGRPVNSCLVLALEIDGHEVITIEGLAAGGELDSLQEAFIEHGAVQCGFCTPGMILSARALLNRNPHPTEQEIRQAIAGNLCRCTGYVAIVKAIQHVARNL